LKRKKVPIFFNGTPNIKTKTKAKAKSRGRHILQEKCHRESFFGVPSAVDALQRIQSKGMKAASLTFWCFMVEMSH
jgi:hypothetical protein